MLNNGQTVLKNTILGNVTHNSNNRVDVSGIIRNVSLIPRPKATYYVV